MEHNVEKIDMRKYIIDQAIQFIVCVAIEVFFYFETHSIRWVMLVLEVSLICSVLILLWRIMVFPLDILHGRVEQDVHFSKMYNIDEYAVYGILRRRYFCEWNFYFSAKGKLNLLVPVCQKYEDILEMNRPATDQKVRICYYKYSKILYSWESL